MATVKIKWRPSTVEGKAGTIYYQIIHNRTVRQLKSDCKVFRNEWIPDKGTLVDDGNAADGRREAVGNIRKRIQADVGRLKRIIGRMASEGNDYTADDIVAAFGDGTGRRQSFFGFMRGVMDRLKEMNKFSTMVNYAMTLNSFARFRQNEDLAPDEIDADMMMRYEAYLAARGVRKNTVSFYMRILRAVYNRAVEQRLAEQRNPFRHVYTGIDKTVKRAIPLAAIRRIKALDLTPAPALEFARDMFMFSFYMRGMSFVDMACLRKDDLRNGVVSYRRRKTGQHLSVRWERCMQEIADKYGPAGGQQRGSQESPYMLPILNQPFDGNPNLYRGTLHRINKSLKTVARMAGLEIQLTMYVARHSWASAARAKNIPVSVISEGMGHDSEATTKIYLASLDTSVIDRANRLIINDL